MIKINICFLLGGFQGNGGIGRVTSILANELSKKENYNIFTLSYCDTGKPLLYKLHNEIYQSYLYNYQLSMTKAILFHNAISRIKKYIVQNNIDIIVACGALYYPLSILAKKGTRAKCICWEHTSPFVNTDYRFQNFSRKFGIRYGDKLAVLTKSTQSFYINKYKANPKKINQIYNPIDKKIDGNIQYNNISKKIISVGRLSYPKNFELLIDIAAIVFDNHPDWTWDIYGSGELHDALQLKIDTCRLTDKLILKGQVEDLCDRYKDYSFCVMTSRYEGFPMSLLEAGANGLPLVSFDIPTGPNEIIDDGENGYLVQPFDSAKMVQYIDDLIENEELRINMSILIKEKTIEFKLNKIIIQWTILFDSLLEEK